MPGIKVEVEKLAVPLLSEAEPMMTDPSLNVTFPVAAAGATAAVNITAWPTLAGFRDDERLVVVAAAARMVSVRAADVAALLAESPP